MPLPLTMQSVADEHQLASLAKRLVEVPDLLVEAQLSLRPLANGDMPGVTADVRHIVGNACDLLHSAQASVLEVTRLLSDFSSVNNKPPSPGSKKADARLDGV